MPSPEDILRFITGRLAQNAQATQQGQIAGRDVGNVPVLGGIMTAGGNPNGLSPVNALNTLGVVNDAAGVAGKTLAGELALLTALPQAQFGNPNDSATQASQAALQQGFAHPGRAIDALRNGPDTGAALLSGGLELVSNPLNYVGGVGEFGRGLEAGAPAAGKALQAAALLGEVANRAPLAPLAVIPGARRALLSAPEFLKPAAAAATKAAPEVADLLQSAERQAQARELLADTARQGQARTAAQALPLVPKQGEFNAAMRAGQLPTLDAAASEPSALAPQSFGIIKAARRKEPITPLIGPNVLNAVPKDAITPAEEAAAKAAVSAPLLDSADLAGPDLPDYGAQARHEVIGGLASDEIDQLLHVAYGHENGIANAINKRQNPVDLAGRAIELIQSSSAKGRMLADAYPELAKKLAYLPEAADPLEAVRGLIGTEATRVGTMYPPEDPAFYAQRLGVNPDDVPGLLQQLEQDGTLGRDHTGALAVKPKPRPIMGGGDIAAGGDDKIIPFRGGLTAANRAVGGALTGGLVGGAAGATQGYTTQDRLENALVGAGTGALVGGNLGAASPEIAQLAQHLATTLGPRLADTGVDPGFWLDAARKGWEDQVAASGAKTARGLGEMAGAAGTQWRQQVVNTLKQIPQDALQRAFTNWGTAGKEFGTTGGDFQRWQGILRGERVGNSTSLTNPLTARLRALGRIDVLSGMKDVYGVDYATSLGQDGQKQLGGLGRAVVGAGISATPSVRNVPVVAPLYGAVRGYFAPFVNGAIGFVNGIQHDAFRYALAEKALDRDIPQMADAFLNDLAAQGVNVSSLQGVGGFFSPTEVEAVAGQQAAKEWDGLTAALVRAEGDRIAFLGGDFRDKLNPKYTGTVTRGDRILGNVERGVGKVVPFARWSIRNAPVLAEIAANHPRAVAVIGGLLAASAAEAKKEGLKWYQVGTIPISTETPVMGAAARAYLGGKKGTVRLNALGAVASYSGDMLQAPDLDGDQTGYQKAKSVLGLTGFQPSPGIQTAAYLSGQDYQGPGALSRTAGLEQLPGLLPGTLGATMPSGMAALDKARDLVEPTLDKAGVATAGPTTEYDPVMRRYDELVQTQTGKPLNDIANRQYLISAGDPDNPLWQQARQETILGGAAQNVSSMSSPVSAQGQTDEALATQQAKGATPYTQAQIAGSSPGVQALMQQGNNAYLKAAPAASTYKIGNQKQQKQALLDQALATPRMVWMAQFAPKSYQQNKDQIMIQLGLRAAPAPARQNPYLVPTH